MPESLTLPADTTELYVDIAAYNFVGTDAAELAVATLVAALAAAVLTAATLVAASATLLAAFAATVLTAASVPSANALGCSIKQAAFAEAAAVAADVELKKIPAIQVFATASSNLPAVEVVHKRASVAQADAVWT